MELKVSHLKKKLKEGGVCFGTMLRILKTPQAVALYASDDWDYIILDTEHNDYDFETLSNLAFTSKYEKLSLLIRVPDKHYHQLARALDIGAEGLVLPNVKTVEEAQYIISSVKYAPAGQRGVSMPDNVTLFRPFELEEYLHWANRELLTVIQIESIEGVKNIDEILEVKGVDAVMIGPSDLTQDMGIPGQIRHQDVADAYHRVIESCNQHGVAPGIHLNDFEDVHTWLKAGMRFITYSYDTKLFKDISRSSITKLRSMVLAPAGKNQ